MVPALAVADALRAEGHEVVFVGGAARRGRAGPGGRLRAAPARRRGDQPQQPAEGGARGREGRRRAAAARRMLRAERPDVVMGGGGYVAGPVGAAAVLARIPLVLTEADSHLGLTNRALARFARRVCLAFPIDGRDGRRYLRHRAPGAAAGRPTARPRASASASPRTTTCVLVFGGSLGARSINEAAIEAFAGAAFRVLHACGARDYPSLRDRVPAPAGTTCATIHHAVRRRARGLRPVRRARRRLDLRDRCARASGAARALSARRRRPPERERALDAARRGGGRGLPTRELTAERLAREVGELLGDPGRLRAMARASAGLARPDAARAIASELAAAAAPAR